MHQSRRIHTVTLLTDGRVLAAGGCGFSGPIGDTEIFDPDTESDGATTDFEQTWATAGSRNNLSGTNPNLADPYNRADPDFAPQGGSPALNAGCTPPNDGFFDQVTYLGAVAGAADTWYRGWTTTAEN